MAQLQLWTLEQSILGCGKHTHDNATLEQLLAWAQTAEPSESVPSLVWRTELALVYLQPGQPVYQDRSLQRLMKALGYPARDTISNQNAIKFGAVPIGGEHRGSINSRHRKHSFKIYSLTFGVVWSWDPTQRLTKGVIYGNFNRGWRKIYRVLNGIRRHTNLRTNPLLLGLMTLSAEVYDRASMVYTMCEHVEAAQIKTGRHTFADTPRNLDTRRVNWAELSSDVCGSAVNLSTCTMWFRILLKLADFIVEESNAICMGTYNRQLLKQAGLLTSLHASNIQVCSLARQYRLRTDGLLEETQSYQWRAEILVQTVFTLATQRDQKISIEIARNSITLARQATKDSTSMKSIAAVTMFFLPGTLVASLFAMPMFVWRVEPGRSVSGQFWIYWAVTIPLTLTVVGIWLGWTNREDLKRYFASAKREAQRRDSESYPPVPGEHTLGKRW